MTDTLLKEVAQLGSFCATHVTAQTKYDDTPCLPHKEYNFKMLSS